MADVTETVGNTVKTGAKAAKGVPPYVWIIAVVGGLGVAYVMNKQKGASATNATNSTAPTALVYTGTGQTDNSNTSTGQSTSTGFLTNEAWAQAAKNWLISQGTDAKEASDAVDLYINAQALNAKQNAMISTVTRAIGAPPQSLPPTTGSPTPTQDTWSGSVWGNEPVMEKTIGISGTKYTVKDGDTLVGIAKKAYGLAPNDYSSMSFASDEILNANYQVINDVGHLTPGTQLYIPVLPSQSFPGFGTKVPQYGYKSGQPGEWQMAIGQIPSSANTPTATRNR